MTTTIERPSTSIEASKINLEFIPDEQLRQIITHKIDTLDSLYHSYLSDPSQVPDDWKEKLEGLDPEDHAVVLAELCITSDAFYPGFTEDENPPAETIKLYNQIRETAFERLTSEEKTYSVNETSSDSETNSILERRMNYRMKRSLINTREARATKVGEGSSFANEIPAAVGTDKAKALELTGTEKVKIETVLYEYAEEYAAKLAKESDRSLGQLFHERSDSHIREELTDMMGLIATHLMDKAEETGLSTAERDSLIETKLTEVTAMVIQKMADARLQEYNESSPIRKYIYSKWSTWAEQGRAGKVKQGIVMGAISAPIALFAAPVAGFAVGAGLAGAMIATGSRSLGRGLISAHINQKANAPENINKDTNDIRSRVLTYKQHGEEKERNSFDVLNLIDSNVDKYRRRNRRRVLGGVGIAMTVGLVSATAAEFLSNTVFEAEPAKANSNNDSSQPNREALASSENRVDLGAPKDVAHFDHRLNSDGRNGVRTAINAPNENFGREANVSSGQLGREGMFQGYHGSRGLTPEGEKMLTSSLDNYRVKSGDTIWDLSEQVCNEQGIKNPSVYEIDATKDLLLERLQASGSVDKSGMLTTGTRLKL